MTYIVQVNGTAVFVHAGSLAIHSTIGKRSTASFTVQSDQSLHFAQYQQVKIYDQSNALIFSGYVSQPKEEQLGFQPSLTHSITCIDQHYLADKRIVAAVYTNRTIGSMVQDIWKNVLSQEGVTIAQLYDGLIPSTVLYPSPTLYPNGNVGTINNVTFGYCTVADAMDRLAQAASEAGVPYYWQIDQFKRLYFVPYTAIVNNDVIDGTQMDMVSVIRQNTLYRNTQYVIGGVAQTSIQNTTRTGDGKLTTWPMDYDLAMVPTITLNTVAKTVGIRGLDSGKDFYWQKGSPDISQDSAATKLTSSDTLAVSYVGQYPNAIIAQNGSQIAYQQNIDGTSGINEDVNTDATIESATTGIAKVSQLLTRYGVQGTLIEGQTLESGYQQGQLVTYSLPQHQLNNVQALIESVDASDSRDGLNVWYTVKAVVGPYDVGWVEFFGNLLKQNATAANINIGVTQTVTLARTFTAKVRVSVTFGASTYACPLPSSTLWPSASLHPC